MHTTKTQWLACPFCGKLSDAVTNLSEKDARLTDGDIVLCFDCSGLQIYDSGRGCYREASSAEMGRIDKDKLRYITDLQAWIRRQRSPTPARTLN